MVAAISIGLPSNTGLIKRGFNAVLIVVGILIVFLDSSALRQRIVQTIVAQLLRSTFPANRYKIPADEIVMTDDGKTLAEFMVILLVIGVLSGLAGPNLRSILSRAQLQAVTQEVASELRLARQLATTHREKVVVAFDTTQNTLAIKLSNGQSLYHVYDYRNREVFIDEPSGGKDILFYPNGCTATATTIRLLGKEGQVQELTVGITGRVTIR